MTLAEYAPDWLRTMEPPVVRPSTYSFYRTLVEAHLADIGHHRVTRLTVPIVRALVERRQKQGYKPRTILAILDVLRMVLRQAMADGIVEQNVVELVRRPRLERKEAAHLTADEQQRFLAAAKDDDLFSLFVVALDTGLRRGELLALTWSDVVDGTVVVREAKTAAGERVVPLSPRAQAALAALERRPGRIWVANPTTVTRRTAAICAKAGVRRLTTHGLRHTASTRMQEAGLPLEIRRRILGHTRGEMTLHYTHPELETIRQAMERMTG